MNHTTTLIKSVAVSLCVLMPTLLGAKDKTTATIPTGKALSFMENVGQLKDQNGKARPDIDHQLSIGDLSIYIGDGAVHYQWTNILQEGKQADPSTMTDPVAFFNENQETTRIAYYRMDMELIGANKNAQILNEGQQSYYDNFITRDGKELEAHTFNKITYKDIYPNIDWVLYAKDGKLKYDFIVHPDGKASDIKIKYNGAKSIRNEEGNITITTPMGDITELAPYTYDAATKAVIASSFQTYNTAEGTVIGFKTAAHQGTMVIDPWLEWATYYGGSHQEWGNCSTTDLLGNVYMGGWTYSTNNIVTSGAYQDTLTPQPYSNYYNGFIVKFDVTGTRLWGTYFPGHVSDIRCANNGEVYFTGSIDSIVGLATTGAHQNTFGGHGTYYSNWYQGDAYLAKFSSSGQKIWFTYYGGTENDNGSSLELDGSGNVYMGGSTNSPNNIASTGAHRTTLSPPKWNLSYYWGHSGFIAKFNSNGVRQWATYYPGMVSDIDIYGNSVYACGNTWHDTGVATVGAYQAIHTGLYNGNAYEGFVVKFNNNGVRQWGTYYGGTSYDWCQSIECDVAGAVYFSGNTQSTQGIATANAHQTSLNSSNNYDAFLVKFTPAGSRIWGTYFGGSVWEYGSSLLVTPSNRLYMSGTTTSSNNIATTGAYQTSLAGGYDDYLVEFDTAGVLQYGTYYGGPGVEYSYGYGGYGWGNGGEAVSYNYTGRLHLASTTASSSGIATTGAHQTTYSSTSSAYDAYLATFIVDTIAYFVHPFVDTALCPGDTVKIPYKVSYRFNQGNTFTMQLSDATGSFASPTTIGTHTDTTGDTITCVIPTNVTTGNEYRMRIVSSSPSRTSVDNFVDISIYAAPTVTATNNGPLCEGDTLRLFATPSQTTTGVTYTWTGPNNFTVQNPVKTTTSTSDAGDYIVTAKLGNCSNKDTTSVVINIIPATPTASSNSPVCPGTDMNLAAATATPGVTYSWTGPGFTSNLQNPTRNNTVTGWAGNYSVTASANGCTSAPATTSVAVYITTPTPSAANNGPLCSGQDLNLTANTIPGATYDWTGPGFTANTQNPTRVAVNANGAGTYTVTATVNGCISLPDTTNVVINVAPSIGIYPSPGDSVCIGQSVTFVAIESNAGSTQNYQWLWNGIPIPGATNKTYTTSSVTSGDLVQCEMTATGQCSNPFTDTSNTVTMVIKPVQPAKVSISANPGTTLSPWQLVTFTANYSYGGTSPQFQWMRNGYPVVGATGSIWGTYNLNNNDTIWVDMISNDPCADPAEATSNKLVINLLLGINDLDGQNGLQLFPNPNDGNFTITGKVNTDKEVKMDVINTVGQVVHTTTALPQNKEIKHQVQTSALASGMYMIRIYSENDIQTIKFNVK